MKLVIDIPDKEWEEWENGLGIIHTKPLTEALEKAKPLQEELEKIKAEITACTIQEEGEVPACINYGIKLSTEIVEKHISELKEK